MMSARNILLTLALAVFPLGCAPMGCAGEDPEMDAPPDEQFAGAKLVSLPAPTPGTQGLYGTWKGDTVNMDAFETLVLMTDGRYHAARNVTCIKAPCPPIAEEGTFKLYAREKRSYIELMANGGIAVKRYEYLLRDGLQVRPLEVGSEWRSMGRANAAWCGRGGDCSVQNLPPGPCAGSYACVTDTCQWSCARGEESATDPGTTGK